MIDERWKDASAYDLDGEDGSLEIVEEGYGKYRRPDAVDPEEEARRQRKAKRAFKLTIVVMIAVIAGFIFLSMRDVTVTDEERLREITSLQQASYLFAEEDTLAVGTIRRRFGSGGMQLPFTDGVIAQYLFLTYPVDIWVGMCTLQDYAQDAYSLLQQLTDPADNVNWRNQSQFQRGTYSITQVVGKGQRSYFYRDSNMIVWVSSDSITAPFALEVILNTNLRSWLDSVRQGG
jgi:hypothetical protein